MIVIPEKTYGNKLESKVCIGGDYTYVSREDESYRTIKNKGGLFRNIRNLIGGLVVFGTVTGCAEFYEGDKLNQLLFGYTQETLPGWAQSEGWKEYKRRERERNLAKGDYKISGNKKSILNEMKIEMIQIDQMYKNGYISENERKKIKLTIELNTLKKLGSLNEDEYKLYMENIDSLSKTSKEYFH